MGSLFSSSITLRKSVKISDDEFVQLRDFIYEKAASSLTSSANTSLKAVFKTSGPAQPSQFRGLYKIPEIRAEQK